MYFKRVIATAIILMLGIWFAGCTDSAAHENENPDVEAASERITVGFSQLGSRIGLEKRKYGIHEGDIHGRERLYIDF